ncbi:MAG TPA: TonB-dependent receptor [Opitutaceae bacterium]
MRSSPFPAAPPRPRPGRRLPRLAAVLAGLVLPLAGVRAEPEPAESVAALKKLSLEQLMDVEVTSVSRRPEKLAVTPSAIQVITGDDIRRSGASSIPEALRLASNLAVAQRDSWQWAISSRGFNSTTSNKLLVMIDGRTLYTPLYAGVFWDAQDTLLEDVDRIEVVSGPGATLWGANAVNGVINLVTKSARDTQGLLLLGGGGTELRGFAGVRYGGEIAPNLHYRVYAKYFDRDSSVRAVGGDAGNDWHMGQGGFRVDWQASSTDLLTLQGDFYANRVNQSGTSDDNEASGGNLLGRWSHTLASGSDFQLQWYYDRTHRHLSNSIEEDLGTYDVDFQHRFTPVARHDIIWGAGYRLIDDRVHNPPNLAFLPADVTREWVNAFVQDELTLLPGRLHLTVGSKFEHNEYTGWEIQPSARLAWQPAGTHTAWASVSRAMRTPSRIDRELYAPAEPPFTLVAGGPDFDSEELIAYELGYRVQPIPRLAVAASGFYHDYDDLRSLERLNPPAPFPFVIGNGFKGESYGAELTADYRPTDWWRLRAGFTRQLIHLQPKPGSTDASSGSSESQDTNHILLLRSSLDLPGDVELDAIYRHIGEIATQGVPAYDELEVRVGWRPTPSLELSLVGQNLLHEEHVEFGSSNSRQAIERGVHGKVVWLY